MGYLESTLFVCKRFKASLSVNQLTEIHYPVNVARWGSQDYPGGLILRGDPQIGDDSW